MAIVKGFPLMFALVFVSCIFTLAVAEGTWCVANPSKPDSNHQKDVDVLCGAVGVDCSLIKPGGSCFQPNNVKFHASVVFNQYYQARLDKNSCNFGGDAMFTNTDPSSGTCKFSS